MANQEAFQACRAMYAFLAHTGGEVTYHGPGQLVVYPIINLHLFNQDLHWYLRSLEEVIIRCANTPADRSQSKGSVMVCWVWRLRTCVSGRLQSLTDSMRSGLCSAFQMSLQARHLLADEPERLMCRCLEEVSGLSGEQLPGLTGVWVDGKKVAAIGVRAQRWVTYHGLAINLATDLRPFRLITPCGIHGRAVTSVKVISLHILQTGSGQCHQSCLTWQPCNLLLRMRPHCVFLDAGCTTGSMSALYCCNGP